MKKIFVILALALISSAASFATEVCRVTGDSDGTTAECSKTSDSVSYTSRKKPSTVLKELLYKGYEIKFDSVAGTLLIKP